MFFGQKLVRNEYCVFMATQNYTLSISQRLICMTFLVTELGNTRIQDLLFYLIFINLSTFLLDYPLFVYPHLSFLFLK